MKKEKVTELTDKELRDRLDAAEKEYAQTKIQHTIAPLDNTCQDYDRPSQHRTHEN